MNDRDPIAVLDDRARAASAALNRNANERPVPGFDADASRTESTAGDGTRQRWLAAAAAAVLVVGGVVAIASWSGDPSTSDVPSTNPSPTTAPPLNPLILDDTGLPFTVEGAKTVLTVPEGSERRLGAPFAAYGRLGELPELGIMLVPDAADLGTGGDVDLGGGRTGYLAEAGRSAPLVLAVPAGDDAILLYASPSSRLHDRDELARIARELRVVDGEVVGASDVLPDGWQRTGADPNASVAALATAALGPSEPAYVLELAKRDVDGAGVGVTLVRGDEQRLIASAPMFETSRVEVRGRGGLLQQRPLRGPGTDLTLRGLSWVESPGNLVQLQGVGISDDDLFAIADALRPATAAEWTALAERLPMNDEGTSDDKEVPPDTTPPAGEAVLAAGSFDDGTGWMLMQRGSDLSNVALVVDRVDVSIGGGIDSVGRPRTPFVLATWTASGNRRFVAGLVRDDVARVEVRSGDRATEADIVRSGRRTVFIAEAATPDGDLAVVAFDEDGGELATLPLEFADDRGGPDEVDGTPVIDEEGEIVPIPTSYREAPASTGG